MLFARYYNQLTQNSGVFKAINCLVNNNYKRIILKQLKNSRFVFLKRNKWKLLYYLTNIYIYNIIN